MNSNLIRSLGLVAAIAIIPATTAALAQVDTDSYRDLDEFVSVLNRVRSDYVDQVEDRRLIRGAIDGMLASLDPHSSYLDASDFQTMMSTTEGNYGGLGLTVTMEDGAVKVIAATRGTPADQAGIRPGDFITHIDGQLFLNGTLDEAVGRMRGEPGTAVRLRVVRPGREQPLELSITRAVIDIQPVRWEVRDRVGVLTITAFNRNTTEMARRAITEIQRQNPNVLGYVIDLRSNPGGLLDQAIGLSDVFLTHGEIVSQRGRRRTDIERYYAESAVPGDMTNGLPLVVLVDAGSASASEIVAAALQDQRRAVVMGERSFGKGSVQTLIPLGDGNTALRLTTARYFTPSGRSVQEGGIQPDIAVPQLSDPDFRNRTRVRESDLRRHLINESAVRDDVIQDDQRQDPRFTLTAEQLRARNIDDYQLYYAVQSISRLGGPTPPRQAQSAPAQGAPAAPATPRTRR